jgi:hypothetical protein
MKNKYIIYLLIFFLFLAGCDSLKKSLGFEKDAPDAFLIKKRDPINMPPNYDLLPPDSKSKVIKKKNNNDLKNILSNSNTEAETNSKDTKPSSIEEEVIKNIK